MSMQTSETKASSLEMLLAAGPIKPSTGDCAAAVSPDAARRAGAFHRQYDVWLSSTLASPPVRLGTFNLDERDPKKSFAPLIDYV
jgi:hypothetical protein